MNEKVFVTQDDDNDDVRIPALHGRCSRAVLQNYPEHEQGHRGTGGHLQRSFSPGLQFKMNARPSILGSPGLEDYCSQQCQQYALKLKSKSLKELK